MKNQFVPYTLALKLKELGFDEPCITRFETYFNKDLYPVLATLSLNGPYENEYNGYCQKIINDNEKKWFFTGYKNSVKDHNNDIVSAPLWQQAFDWLLNNFKILDSASIEFFSDGSGNINDFYDNSNKTFQIEFGTKKECLNKLIEIVEQQNKNK